MVCLLGASFHTGNLGVNALASSAYKCVRSAFPNSEIFLLDYGRNSSAGNCTIGQRTFRVPVVNLRFSKKLYLANNVAFLLFLAFCLRIVPSTSFRRWVVRGNGTLQQLERISFGAAISGGDSFSDIYGVTRFFYVVLPAILLLLLGKKLVLLPQTIGPFKRWYVRKIALWIVARAAVTYSRDHEGYEYLVNAFRGAGHQPELRFCYDMAFVLDRKPPTAIRTVGLSPECAALPLVGLNMSGLLFSGGYTRQNMFRLKSDYRTMIRHIVAHCLKERGVRVLLVPHVFSDKPGLEDDLVACKLIYDEFAQEYPGRIGYLEGDYNDGEVKFAIGECDFFLGSRMHACIAAVSQCIPALSLAYSSKFQGVMGAVGINELVLDLRDLDEQQILERFDHCFDRRPELRDQLQAIMPQVRSIVLRVVEGL